MPKPRKNPPGDAGPKSQREHLRTHMMRSVVTEPLLSKLHRATAAERFDVIIALNEQYKDGLATAMELVQKRATEWEIQFSNVASYLFANLSKTQILKLADEARELKDKGGGAASVVYRIWEDNDISVTLTKSLVTVKADAAQRAFRALGQDITWAVLDSGIDRTHPHFAKRDDSPFGPIDTLKTSDPLKHLDFTPAAGDPLSDALGHGTHVAGIIAGYWKSDAPEGSLVVGTEARNEDDENGAPIRHRETLSEIHGVAPQCQLLSLKVIADKDIADKQTAGNGKVSWLLKAIDQIQEWNLHGKRLTIDSPNAVHGVNMSLGYEFDPRWFGCGQSPLCVEVNRLVKSGVVVVVSAGNSGYSTVLTADGGAENRYNSLSITDPGNADLAITVGSTHREKPHLYGVSYYSSRGPTGDGRCKPDLVAPGERIVSCAAGAEAQKYQDAAVGDRVLYVELTGTSMAAPHVSGAIAAFLSVRREFIGDPERVKEILLGNAVDLRRDRAFQGAGLLDIMKALQAV